MTDLLIHDSGRSGKVGWTTQLVEAGDAAGFIVSPWETPPVAAPRRPSAESLAAGLKNTGARVLFDPESYGVFLRGANRRGIYNEWRLWPGRGPRKDMASFSAHVERVVEIQESLDVPFLAPTIGLEAPVGDDADLVIDVFAHMRSLAGDAGWIAALVGTPSFWSSGRELDAYIGRVATLRPHAVVMSILRATGRYPWIDLTPEEIAGVCRTTRSLSTRMAVIVGRSDFAGLPAVAAGASGIGTGWDLKQRVLSGDLFRTDPGVRRPSQRVSHRGLFASLKRQEAERLRAGNAELSARLVPGDLPLGFNGQWRHHLAVLAGLAADVGGGGPIADRVAWLHERYAEAANDFVEVARYARPLEATESQWLAPLADGLRIFADAEPDL